MTDMEMDLMLANAEIKRLKAENETMKKIITKELLSGFADALPRLIDSAVALIDTLIDKQCSLEGDLHG